MDSNTLVQIFFVITAAAVIVITIAIVILTIYVFSVIKTIKRIVGMAESAGKLMTQDLSELHATLKGNGLVGGLASFILGRATGKSKTTKKKN